MNNFAEMLKDVSKRIAALATAVKDKKTRYIIGTYNTCKV